ncbi:MAG: flagellar hook-length control protein FliK [Zoogloea sp.]|nr:flagellar hook-length control protein FliK [Zoogloea sp.]
MSGPALNPIANTAPVAPAKGSVGPRTDTPAEASGASPSEQGFATELQRRMQNQAQPDETAAEDKTAVDADETATTDASAAAENLAATQIPPELAALLAASAQPPAQSVAEPLAPAKSDAATLDIDARAGRTALLAAAAEGGTPGPETADDAVRPANLAADALAGASVAKAKPELAVTGTGTSPERLAEPAAPTNNFAAIHAAALANMRGEVAQAAAAPLHLHVAAPAGSPAWPEEVGNRVSWMVGHDESHAELTLTPPQLGKVEISITVSGDQTSAQFVAATPAARELIEQSLPRLREILEQGGINLGQTDVGTSGQPGNPGEGRRGSAWSPAAGDIDGKTSGATASPWLKRAEGLVDTFA